jgi:general secretion pathway protein F
MSSPVPRFRYIAIDSAGKSSRGVLEGASASAVAERLQSKGFLLLDAHELGRRGAVLDFLTSDVAFERGMRKPAVAYFLRELAVMIGAGQDVDYTLRFLAENGDDKRSRKLAEDLRNDVRGGKPLSVAMATHPRVFSPLYLGMVRAGEAGGKLGESLAQLAELLERENKFAASVQSALIYPALLILAAIATIVLLLTDVLPQFTPIFEQAGAELPGPTRILIASGDFLRDQGVWLFVVLLAIAFMIRQAWHQVAARRAIERVTLMVPILGSLIRRIQAARLARTLGTLVRNGVGLVPALVVVRGVLASRLAEQIVDAAADKVRAGARLSGALAEGGVFPPQLIQLLRLGEETGRLGEMALRAAAIHEDQVQESMQRLVSLLIPVITIVMGLLVAGIVSSLVLAMLSLNDLAG